MTHPYDQEKARKELAVEQRTWPVPPHHYWATRRANVVLLRQTGPRFVEITGKADQPPAPVQVVGVRRRLLSPSRVVLQGGDGSKNALHIPLPSEASPAQIGHDRTKPLPDWMVLDGGITDGLDLVAAVFIGIARLGWNLAHLPSMLARQARRRAAVAAVVAALS